MTRDAVTQRPAPGRYVVPVTADDIAPAPAGVRLEPVDDARSVAEADGPDGWEQVAAATGAPWVAPVVVDAADRESYPTGEIVVRFTRRPDDRVLAQVERDDGLRLVRRNAYVDTQVVLEPVDRGVYLPDLSARLERRDDVSTVWLGTTSRYERTDTG